MTENVRAMLRAGLNEAWRDGFDYNGPNPDETYSPDDAADALVPGVIAAVAGESGFRFVTADQVRTIVREELTQWLANLPKSPFA